MAERQFANNAKGQFEAGISSIATTFLMKSGFEDRFPTHNGTTDKNYYLTFKKFDTDGVSFTKQEIVLVTARTGNAFTITRSAGFCPSSSTATTQTNTAFAFDTDDYVEMTPNAEILEEMRTELARLETDKANDSEVVHNTGNEAVGGVKTFDDDGAETTTNAAPSSDKKLVNKKYVDDQVLAATIIDQFTNSDFYPGEDLTVGEAVFQETGPTFAEATVAKNIGDATANTRFSFPSFGSGVAFTTLNLSLKKFVSPGVDLFLRIETDNAGEPSGTLADANATATITAASLTTSLTDETVTLAGSVTLTKGTKYHIVLFQGTYGEETINATNYYGIGTTANNTTTRGRKLWNGSVWSAVDNAIRSYTSSDGFLPQVLSLTDSDFSYKSDFFGFVKSSTNIGTACQINTLGITENQTGLTYGATYYLAATPGAISASGTIVVGKAISTTQIDIIRNGYIAASGTIDTGYQTTGSHSDSTTYTPDYNGFLEVHSYLGYQTSASMDLTQYARFRVDGVTKQAIQGFQSGNVLSGTIITGGWQTTLVPMIKGVTYTLLVDLVGNYSRGQAYATRSKFHINN